MRILPRSLLVVLTLFLTLACGTEPERREATPLPPVATLPATATTRPAPAPTVSTTTAPPAAVDTPDDARRFLEERGIDPGELSHEAAEQLRRRRRPAPPE